MRTFLNFSRKKNKQVHAFKTFTASYTFWDINQSANRAHYFRFCHTGSSPTVFFAFMNYLTVFITYNNYASSSMSWKREKKARRNHPAPFPGPVRHAFRGNFLLLYKIDSFKARSWSSSRALNQNLSRIFSTRTRKGWLVILLCVIKVSGLLAFIPRQLCPEYTRISPNNLQFWCRRLSIFYQYAAYATEPE